MRNIGIIVVSVLWILLGWKMCTDYSVCCDQEEVARETTTPVPATTTSSNCQNGILCFADNSCDAIYAEEFSGFRDSLITLVTSGKKLRITGIYNTDEDYQGASSNLGTCRAESIRKAFANLTDDQVITTGQLTVGRIVGQHERYALDIVDEAPSINTEAVIYFPFNSTNKLNDREIETYLDKVAQRLKDSGEKVLITGHTDNIGGIRSNTRLGQRRANIIADYLMGQGILRSQITAQSKGEGSPVASNQTEVGRAKNRRTELQIIK